MPNTSRISIANRIPDIRRAADFLDEFLEQHRVPGPVANELHVILDEVLSNVIRHGYESDSPREIGFTLACSAHEITLEIDDDGKPFDPTGSPAQPRRANRAAIDPGGLGLVFLHAFADSVAYRRDGARNRLTISRRLPEPAAAAPGRRNLELCETREGEVRILEVEGRLDSTNAWALKERLTAMIEEGAARVVVDAAGIGYVGSAGFWALLLIDRHLRTRGGELALCGLSEEFARAVEHGGFASVMSIFASRREALAAAREAE
jgi:anti-anti-sigma factor